MSGSSFVWAVWSYMLNKYFGALFAVLNTFTDTKTLYLVMKHMKLFWSVGCWISLFLVSIYHNLICCYETAFPVWYSTLIVWVAGVVALSSLTKNNSF